MSNVREIDIKNHTSNFLDNMISIKNLDLNKIKTHEKSYINILIYYIGYLILTKQHKSFVSYYQ